MAPGRGEYDTPSRNSRFHQLAPTVLYQDHGNDAQRFAHLQSIIHTDTWQKEFGRGVTTTTTKTGGQSLMRTGCIPAGSLVAFFLAVNPHLIGGEVSIGLRFGRSLPWGRTRLWLPRLGEVNR